MTTATHRDHAPSASPAPTVSVWQMLGRAVPTAAVVLALAGLACWGHFSDWSMPTFSSLLGWQATPAEPWCEEHGIAEAQCIECHSELLPSDNDYGWCQAHGVAQCPLEHPDVAELATAPTIEPARVEQAARALALKPRTENNSRCSLHRRRVQFASQEAVEKAGVEIAVVKERPLVESIDANGEVVYDQTRFAHLSSRVAGTVYRVEKQVGDSVRKGEVLALVDAADVGRAKADLLQAIAQMRLKQATCERLRPLANGDVLPARQFREAEAALQEAQIRVQGAQQSLVNLDLFVRADDFTDVPTAEIAKRIQLLGLSDDLVASLGGEIVSSNLLPLRAPLDGLIVERHVVQGEVVDTSTVLFGVADTRRLWLTLHVRHEEAKYVAVGQGVLFHASESKHEAEIRGAVDWISTSADDQTRTVKVRVNLPNEDGKLRANTFGTGQIVLRQEPKAVFVPNEAVHWDGACFVVFVRDRNYLRPDAPKFFHVRSVRPGVKGAEGTEIIAGLLPGEVIATRNSGVLQAQLLKSNLGAGCGCVDGH